MVQWYQTARTKVIGEYHWIIIIARTAIIEMLGKTGNELVIVITFRR
jgi:hypothetical protein